MTPQQVTFIHIAIFFINILRMRVYRHVHAEAQLSSI